MGRGSGTKHAGDWEQGLVRGAGTGAYFRGWRVAGERGDRLKPGV